MMIEDRYKRLVLIRRTIRRLVKVVTFYIPLRLAWFSIPHLMLGVPFDLFFKAIAVLGLVMPLLYLVAFGFGKPHKEKMGLIKIFGIWNMLLLTQVGLQFYRYHVLTPKEELIPALVQWRYPYGVIGLSSMNVKRAAQVIEALLDIVGIGSLIFLTLGNKEYVIEQREQKRAAGTESNKKDD